MVGRSFKNINLSVSLSCLPSRGLSHLHLPSRGWSQLHLPSRGWSQGSVYLFSLYVRSLEARGGILCHSPIPSSVQPLWTLYNWKNAWCPLPPYSAILLLLPPFTPSSFLSFSTPAEHLLACNTLAKHGSR